MLGVHSKYSVLLVVLLFVFQHLLYNASGIHLFFDISSALTLCGFTNVTLTRFLTHVELEYAYQSLVMVQES